MKMYQWEKLPDRIFVASDDTGWKTSRAYVPTPLKLNATTIRVYVAFLDSNKIGRVGYVDVDARDPSVVKRVSAKPVLDIGRPGMFDDSGVAPVCVLEVGAEYWMYYIGFQRSVFVPYHIFTGLAVSRDSGETFQRISSVPILDRTESGSLLRSSPFVMPPSDTVAVWRMWYSAGSQSEKIEKGWVPGYGMYYAESANGIDWHGSSERIMAPSKPSEFGVGKPWVRRSDEGWEMFYSIRSEKNGYRIGYAVSKTGTDWQRQDNRAGIDVSATGWDSEMVAFPALCEVDADTYMFYNGNGIGLTGFGAAKLVSTS